MEGHQPILPSSEQMNIFGQTPIAKDHGPPIQAEAAAKAQNILDADEIIIF